jgi:hypothetical protein
LHPNAGCNPFLLRRRQCQGIDTPLAGPQE